jgi:p-cumate 2,3-dioxygenase alpha subunit
LGVQWNETAVGPESRIDELVDDRGEGGIFRVNRRTMTSPGILDLERSRVFDRCWLYLGHDSEIVAPNDYLRRNLNGRPLVFLRDAEGTVRSFFNTCTHRGAAICREPRGNAKTFQCFYHAWTFNNSGQLVALPDEAGYGESFDRSCYALVAVPRLECYRGLWFVGFSADLEPLTDYLAGAKEYIDLVMDQSEAGMRVVPGSNIYATNANWKLLVENSIDGYHAMPVHQTYIDYVRRQGGAVNKNALRGGAARSLGNGHAVMEYEAPWARPIAYWEPLFDEKAKPEIEAKRRELIERFGEERAHRMAETFRNLLIFPNLILNDIAAITLLYVEPVRPDYMQITAWELAPVLEKGETLARRLDSYLTFIGPGGLATPDDVEALESCQRGFAAVAEVEWSDISRGMGRTVPLSHDELQMRSFWRQWRDLMATGGAA